VNVHEGDPVTYEWDFADGTELLTETNGTVTHAFAEQGRYNVTVRAYNELSEDLAWVTTSNSLCPFLTSVYMLRFIILVLDCILLSSIE